MQGGLEVPPVSRKKARCREPGMVVHDDYGGVAKAERGSGFHPQTSPRLVPVGHRFPSQRVESDARTARFGGTSSTRIGADSMNRKLLSLGLLGLIRL